MNALSEALQSGSILLREGWREGHKTRKRTLANLSHWPAHKVQQLRRVLRDEPLVAPDALFTVTIAHGRLQWTRNAAAIPRSALRLRPCAGRGSVRLRAGARRCRRRCRA